jgi:hypothetical protein
LLPAPPERHVIGTRGARLKQVGTRGRRQVEARLGAEGLSRPHVKIAKDCLRNPGSCAVRVAGHAGITGQEPSQRQPLGVGTARLMRSLPPPARVCSAPATMPLMPPRDL